MADESQIYTWLVGGSPSAVSALVGLRVYPVQAPQGVATPYVTYSLVAAVPANQLDGVADVDQRRIQIDTYAATYAEARSVMSACRNELEWGIRGYCISENFTDYEADTQLFRCSADFSFWLPR